MVRKTRVTPGAGKGFDAEDFVLRLKSQKVTPHIAISQRCRKRIKESFGWAKTIGGAAKLKLRGLAKAKGFFAFRMIAYNFIRIPKLLAQAA